jgi:hypothetical protein
MLKRAAQGGFPGGFFENDFFAHHGHKGQGQYFLLGSVYWVVD